MPLHSGYRLLFGCLISRASPYEALRDIRGMKHALLSYKYDSPIQLNSALPLPIRLTVGIPSLNLMFRSLYTKVQSIWKPHTSPSSMDHPFRYVLSKEYKDPNKIAAKLDEFLGKDGWSKLEVSFAFCFWLHGNKSIYRSWWTTRF